MTHEIARTRLINEQERGGERKCRLTKRRGKRTERSVGGPELIEREKGGVGETSVLCQKQVTGR